MKAIETKYNKHLFRSRLEARWAVYFDSLGIKWIYEPEGYELPGGERYLPDFYLPEHQVYVEVKPEPCFQNRWLLFTTGIGAPLVILDGPPAIRNYNLYMPGATDRDCCHIVFLMAPWHKYFPWFDGSIGELFGDGDEYDNAVTAACSARFENLQTI